MTNPIFLPKDDYDLPDSFKAKIHYINGKVEEFDLAQQFPIENGVLEIVTKDDIWNWVFVNNVQRIEWDKNFSKMVAIREKIKQKEREDQLKKEVN